MPTNNARRFKHGTLSPPEALHSPAGVAVDRPLSVLHVTQPVDGGVATYVSRLATAQVERGLQVTVACPNRDLVGVLSASGIARVEWPAVRAPGPWLVRETRALQRLVEQVAPDLIHLHSAKAGAAGRMSKDHSRTIFQPHGWSWEAVGRAVGGVVTAWERRAGSRCALLICVSEEERARGLSAGVHANWCVIENAVDIEAFAVQTPEDRMTARASLGLPSAPIVVCLGTLRPAKGQDILVGAWPLVRESVPEATLVIVGDGPERDKLKGLAGEGVEMVGHQDRVVPWLAAADVVAVPSRRDAMSLAMLEAMSTGRSIVASDIPGVARVLDGGGEVVPVGDRVALAAVLIRRLQDPELASAEGAAARRRVEQDFDWDRLTTRMDEAYARVMSGQP